jgi:alkaline phosphatase
VNIYAVGEPAREKLRGNHENTEIGKFIKEYLELDLDTVTRILNSEYQLDSRLADLREMSWIEGAEGEGSLQIQGQNGKRYH